MEASDINFVFANGLSLQKNLLDTEKCFTLVQQIEALVKKTRTGEDELLILPNSLSPKHKPKRGVSLPKKKLQGQRLINLGRKDEETSES